jgi:hypothetical protein
VNRRRSLAVAALIGATLLQWYIALPPPWPVSNWRLGLLGSLLNGIKIVLPGILVGFIVGSHGFILGALVGFLGRLAVAVPFYLENDAGSTTLTGALSHAAVPALSHAIVSAACGGAGQLLRSNWRRSGP